jgi:CRISPR type IV-associated protein Csf3
MRPLKITAWLYDNVVTTDGYLPLDSILADEYIRRRHKDIYYGPRIPGGVTGDLIVPDLPFEKRGSGDDWYWACSFNTATPTMEYISYWHKRFDDHLSKYLDLEGKSGRINITSGEYKNYRMPKICKVYPALVWYAVGDKVGVEDLCRGVVAIGKKTSQGEGFVKKWEVEEIGDDHSEIGLEGELTRALIELPEGAKNYRLGCYGIKPPYWLQENKRVAYVPLAKEARRIVGSM